MRSVRISNGRDKKFVQNFADGGYRHRPTVHPVLVPLSTGEKPLRKRSFGRSKDNVKLHHTENTLLRWNWF